MNELVKVLVAVKNNLLSKGLVQLINGESGFLIVGETNSEFSAMRLIRQHQPDVVLIDTSISIEALRILKRQFGACLLMLAISDSGIDFFRALTAGVDAYLLKNAKPEQLYQTMHQLAARHEILLPVFTPELAKAAGLTQFEYKIFVELAQGATMAEIAINFAITPDAAKTHICRLLEKLGANNRPQAITRATTLRVHIPN